MDAEDPWAQRYKEFLNPDSNMIFHTAKNYTDIFPQNKLVYLSKDGTSVMKSFDPEKVYIIGGIVDKDPSLKLASYNQAKKDKIECQRLPLDYFGKWKNGKKDLTFTHVLHVLNYLYNNNNDWNRAFENCLPQRKYQAVVTETGSDPFYNPLKSKRTQNQIFNKKFGTHDYDIRKNNFSNKFSLYFNKKRE